MEGALDPYVQPSLSITNCVTIKLTDRNYLLWKNQFETFLSGQGLLGFIDGSSAQPTQFLEIPDAGGQVRKVPSPDYQAWTRSDHIVKSWLLGSFSEDVLSIVGEAQTSQDVWITLASHFNRSTSSRLFELQRKLQNISKQNKTMVDYLKEIKVICDQLSSIRNPVSEQMKIFAVLRGLTREYEPIITNIEGSMDTGFNPTYENVVSRLISFDDRLQSYNTSSQVTPHLAFNTERSSSYNSNRGRNQYYRGRSRGSYSTRGRGFHQQISPHQGGNTGPETSRPVCQICGKVGHPALKCWHRFDNSYQHEDLPSALTAMRITEVSDSAGSEWYPDTGATAHVTNTTQRLNQSQPYYGSDSVLVGDGNFLPITHVGSAHLPSTSGNIPLTDVLVCPSITKSLLSVSKLTSEYPCTFKFDGNGVCVKDKVTRKVLTKGRNHEGLYLLENPQFQVFYSTRQVAASDEVWHRRLGHPNEKILQLLSRSNAISINKSTKIMCESCHLGKSSRLSFQESSFSASRPLEKIHCDLWGPSPVVSVQGFRYYVIFIDHFSRFTWFYPLKTKAEFYEIFIKFQKLVENQFMSKINIFQCDGGGEFTSLRFLKHLQESGIQQSISCPHTPEQNGLSERKHRHLTELGLTMMFESHLPHKYWVEAFFTSTFLSNLLPSTVLSDNKSPFEVLNKKKPVYTSLRNFGCACYPTLRDYSEHKFDPKSLKCVFLGYNEKYKGYRCLFPPTGRVYISRHVLFDEKCYPFKDVYKESSEIVSSKLTEAWKLCSSIPQVQVHTPESSTSSGLHSPVTTTSSSESRQLVERLEHSEDQSTSSVEDNEEVEAVVNDEHGTESTEELDPTPVSDNSTMPLPEPQSTAPQPPPAREHTMKTRLQSGIRKPNPKYVLHTQRVAYPEPTTVTAALKDKGWKEAMIEEMDNCYETNTWTLVPRPADQNILGNKWVFRTKLMADGALDRLKARLVAKGYDQEEGIDYLETFSPVVRTATVRLVLHVATINQWDIKQMDVKNAFLHGDLTETVYMYQPAGFVDPSKPDHVCHLHKSLYGLKQSPRAWFDKFSTFLIEFGFVCSLSDPSFFIYNKNKVHILLLLYVDDMILTGNQSDELSKLLVELHQQFRMKDLGSLHYFLGIQVQFHNSGLFLSQQQYAEDLLRVAAMSDCSPMPTPLPLQLDRVTAQEEQFSNPTYFRSLAGKLQYLTLTRPDIQFAVNYICQKMHAPSVSDFNLLKRILRYVKGTVTMGINFNKETDCTLCAYSDSDWAGCHITRRSTGGFCTFLGNNIISWSSKKQPTISKSSTEAEYRSLSATASELKWLSSLLRELGISLPLTPTLYCDNLSAVYLTANPSFHARTKHFDMDHHYVRERVALGTLEVKHIASQYQLADIFTKSLPIQQFCELRFKLGVGVPPTPSLRGGVKGSKEDHVMFLSRTVSNIPNEEESLKWKSQNEPFHVCLENKHIRDHTIRNLENKNIGDHAISLKIPTENRFALLSKLDSSI